MIKPFLSWFFTTEYRHMILKLDGIIAINLPKSFILQINIQKGKVIITKSQDELGAD